MADKKQDVINIQTYKKKWTINIGLVLFGVIFLYMVVTVFSYLTKDRIASYEVREGSILKDTSFTGIAVREETIIPADTDGYINYFLSEGSKIAVGSNACTLSSQPLEMTGSEDTNQEVALSAEDWHRILLKAQEFNESYDSQNFKTAQSLKTDVTTILQDNTTLNRTVQLNSLLENGGGDGIAVYSAPDDGIIEYSVDGYESLTLGEIDDAQLSKTNYTKQEIANNTMISAGSPAYKLITSEDWTLVIKLTPEMETQLADKTSVKVRFTKDGATLWAGFQIYNKGKSDAYGYLSFSQSMIRYASERYLDIELILEDQSGLKIPKSSITTQEFYVISSDYLTTGGASSETGVYLQKKDSDTIFTPVTVFYNDTEQNLSYLSMDTFSKGDVLIKPESSETVTIGKTKKLEGVYNINKGYATFKQVTILCESEDYYIVEEGNKYGLSNYDHIALEGSSVKEDELVSQ